MLTVRVDFFRKFLQRASSRLASVSVYVDYIIDVVDKIRYARVGKVIAAVIIPTAAIVPAAGEITVLIEYVIIAFLNKQRKIGLFVKTKILFPNKKAKTRRSLSKEFASIVQFMRQEGPGTNKFTGSIREET